MLVEKRLIHAHAEIAKLECRIEALQKQIDHTPVVDCRQCTGFSSSGCNRTALCVDANQYQPSFVIQYWVKSETVR